MTEIDIYGIYVPQLLVVALVSAALTAGLQRLLQAVGFYRLVWHKALFDLALFAIMLGGVFLAIHAPAGDALPVLSRF